MFTRRIFAGVVVTWFLLEGTKALWRLEAARLSRGSGWRKTAADDILTVTG